MVLAGGVVRDEFVRRCLGIIVEDTQPTTKLVITGQYDRISFLDDIQHDRVSKWQDLKESSVEVRLITAIVELSECATKRSTVAG